jgi:hypothetical protein
MVPPDGTKYSPPVSYTSQISACGSLTAHGVWQKPAIEKSRRNDEKTAGMQGFALFFMSISPVFYGLVYHRIG